MLNGDKKTIKEILSGNKYSLVNNQREYVWSLGGGQIGDFLYDIKYYSENINEKWFLGQIILLEQEINGITEYKIIDGQQRLTTICLFLAACRDKARELNNPNQEAKLQGYISFVNDADGSVAGLRVSVSKTIKELFDLICANFNFNFSKPSSISNEKWKKQIKLIKNIYEEFKRFLITINQDQLTLIIKAIIEAYVYRLVSTDPEETYSLFENTNAKGTPLEATDLLKNLLLSELGETPQMDQAWIEIAKNSGTTGVRMLKYYYTAKTAKLERKDIYRKIRDRLVRPNPELFIKDYTNFSKFYSVLENSITEEALARMLTSVFICHQISQHEQSVRRIFHSIQAIQLLDVVLCYPLIYTVLTAYSRIEQTDGTRRSLVKFFETLEKFHFVNTYICDSRANRIEILYAEFCEKFINCTDNFNAIITELVNKMRNDYTQEKDIFVSYFKELEYDDYNLSKNTIIYYIFDRFNNFDETQNRIVDPAAWIEYYSPNKDVRRHLNSIEHYAPQNPREDNQISNVHNIGNLFIIGTDLNGRLSNFTPEEKIIKLKNQLFQDIGPNKMLREFVENFNNSWNESTVEQRAKDLAERAYDRIWRI